jgi:tRNA A-37 threonylcarbamoyl transferase component Bud32
MKTCLEVSAPMSANFPQPFGKYYLLNKIALGGMAEIFRAKTVGAEGFEKEVVIKRILPHFTEDDAFRTMFIDEATLAAKLHHANIVQIYDFDLQDGMHYIAMEYVEGRDLKKITELARAQGKRLSVGQVVWIIAEVAKGLQYAHTRKHRNEPLNIVHRDVSPHNVMVSYNGEVKLMDFGIAKAASRYTKTRAGTVKGKCAYMSPEQAKGEELDGRSDLFSLAILAWELLTDKRLFAGETDFETLSNVLKCEVTPASTHNADVPEELDRIIAKALAKDPNERYADCGAFHADLNRFYFTHVADAAAGQLEPFMREVCASEIQSLAAMQAQERTTYLTQASNPAVAQAEDDENAPTVAMPAGSFANDAPTMAVDAASLLPRRTGSSVPAMHTGSSTAASRTGTGTLAGQQGRSATMFVLIGLLIAAIGLVGLFLYLEYGQPDKPMAAGAAVAQPSVAQQGSPGKVPTPEPEQGNLTVVATPAEAIVTVDGAPLEGGVLKDVPLGKTLVVTAEHDGRKVEQVVTMSSVAQTIKLDVPVAAQAPPVTVTIQAPEDVNVRIGSALLGKGTQAHTARQGDELLIEAFRDGGAVYQRRLVVETDGQSIAILDSDVPALQKYATVTLDVSPSDARLVVDGRDVPLADGKATLSDLELGRTIVVEAHAKGYRSEKKEIPLSDEQVATAVKLRKEQSEPVASGEGWVTINARPWADVYYKGKKLGVTPVRKKSFPVGSQKFTLQKGDLSKTVTIQVVKDKEVTKLFDMTK